LIAKAREAKRAAQSQPSSADAASYALTVAPDGAMPPEETEESQEP